MRRTEPFRALLEEARAAQGVPAPAPAPAASLAQRLDQLALAGGTPARGTFVPALDAGVARTPRPSPETDELLAALDHQQELPTRRLPAGHTVDAALQDSLAELEATIEVPAQRRMALRREAPLEGSGASLVSVPEPVLLKDVPRPPPLPAAKPKARPVPVATCAPAPVLSDAAPAAPSPRVLQVLGEENTIPGLSPAGRSSSSSSGKRQRQSDAYRLQLEFEDTPARPLPRIAHVPPPPLPASAKKAGKASARELGELEEIEDLGAMARALGLDGIGDVSIPSLEGLPELDLVRGPTAEDPPPELSAADELFDDLEELAPPRAASDVRRALAHEALENSIETAFPERRSASSGGARPALAAGKAVTPVIVKIPSRPKVSVEARERARKLYLEAVDRLAKGDRTAAVLHLRLAIDYDDGIPLYRDLLSQLEGPPKASKSAEGPALTVLGPRGERSSARDHWRSARPR